jgi:pimeloyl-ACP methyl ester carboxylesterase
MPRIEVNNIELEYEIVGDPEGVPILLVGGLGVQLISWPPHFVAGLVDAGFNVIRYDNRDIGLSTTFDGAPNNPQVVIDAVLSGETPDVAYTLSDMAADAAALIDALGLGSVHAVGVSMGGMIAQALAIEHPTRVRSLTSIMSSTGALDVGQPSEAAYAAIMTSAASTERHEIIAQNLVNAKIWASPEHFDSDYLDGLFNRAWDRAGGPQSANTARHFCAIIASPGRDEALATLDVPTLVVHGTADTLISQTGGERTAAQIPNAELMIIDGMGHDLPPAFAGQIIAGITDLVTTTEAA